MLTINSISIEEGAAVAKKWVAQGRIKVAPPMTAKDLQAFYTSDLRKARIAGQKTAPAAGGTKQLLTR